MKALKSSINDSIVILAGGLVTRLKSLTKNKPKSLIEINKLPFVIHQLRLLKKSGFNDIHMCLGHFGDQIENSINNYSISQELSIKYSYDGPRQLGTGGAIKKIINQLPDYFFVTYGDSYLNVDYNEILIFFNKIKKGDINLMTVYNNKNKWDNSNIIFDGNLIANYSRKIKTKNEFRLWTEYYFKII